MTQHKDCSLEYARFLDRRITRRPEKLSLEFSGSSFIVVERKPELSNKDEPGSAASPVDAPPEIERDEFAEPCSMPVRSRRHARAAALRALYALDTIGSTKAGTVTEHWAYLVTPPGETEESSQRDAYEYGLGIVVGVIENLLKVDTLIEASSEHWTIQRICRVDRNVLRVAVFELTEYLETPVSVIINEALETIKAYGAPEAAGFVNGVLDTVARKVRGDPSPSKVA